MGANSASSGQRSMIIVVVPRYDQLQHKGSSLASDVVAVILDATLERQHSSVSSHFSLQSALC